MDILETIEKKIKFNPQRIYRLIVKQVGLHINGLSEPCYGIKTTVFQNIMYRELGVSEREWKAFAVQSENTLGPKGKGNTYRVPFTYALTYLYYRSVRANQAKIAETILLYLLIKFYGSSYEKFFPEGCQDPVFRYTIDNIVQVHLFYREKTIANSLIFLSRYTQKKFFNRIKKNLEWNPELMHDFMHDANKKLIKVQEALLMHIIATPKLGRELEFRWTRMMMQTIKICFKQQQVLVVVTQQQLKNL